ncbi:DUF1376 domain-containing protein [Methylocaldum gracile]|uniref:DUF1376 domain-containing protein n=1 Tax=Methylocaldum sp. 0917 TaxID=2485163 RepID=UPI0010DA5BC3
MKFFPKNFIADTITLDNTEAGTYALLVCHAWDRDGKLPLDVTALARLARASQAVVKRTTAKLSEAGLAYEAEGFLRFRMVDLDLERVEKVRSTRSNAGKRSAENRRLRIVGGEE